MTNKVTVKVNGATLAYPSNKLLTEAIAAVRSALRGSGFDTYDIALNIQATKTVPAVTFQAGDVYQYKFGGYGQWYTYIRNSDYATQQWSGRGDMTDTDMRNALAAGNARRCTVTPV